TTIMHMLFSPFMGAKKQRRRELIRQMLFSNSKILPFPSMAFLKFNAFSVNSVKTDSNMTLRVATPVFWNSLSKPYFSSSFAVLQKTCTDSRNIFFMHSVTDAFFTFWKVSCLD